jgi:hypothetical protein
MSTAFWRLALAFVVSWLIAGSVGAEPPQIDRSIGKQPTYRTGPQYGLLVFGPEGRDRIWLVRDGDVLYVDRNGNGDLTDPGEKVASEKIPGSPPEGERPYIFMVGDINVGDRTHKGLRVGFAPLTAPSQSPPPTGASKNQPQAMGVAIEMEVEVPGMKGSGIGNRVPVVVGPLDINGFLRFGDTPTKAPVIHVGGPLQITFYSERPSLRVGGSNELRLVVGSPGVGPGTIAMLAYEGTIPALAKPTMEIHFQPAQPGSPQTIQRFDFSDRC